MKQIVSGFIALACPTIVSAIVPVAPVEITLTQPGGSSFTAKTRGTANNEWIEATNGRTIVNNGGTWVYARLDSANELMPTQLVVGTAPQSAVQSISPHLRGKGNNAAAIDYGPVRRLAHDSRRTPETVPLLTLLVSFSDISFSYGVSSWDSRIHGATNSVADFYNEQSYGSFAYTRPAESHGITNDGIITVTLPYPHPDFKSNFGDPAVDQLVADAIAGADPFIDYSSFNADDSAYLDSGELSIMIIAAGYETSYGGTVSSKSPGVWGHASIISPVTHDGVAMASYTVFGERHAANLAADRQATIGIICHELGHLTFGLPDLYDTDGSSEGVGEWALMSSGSWNSVTYSGDSPAHFCAQHKYETGMITLMDYNSSGSFNLAPYHSNAQAARIWLDPYQIEDYLLFENRRSGGYDAGLPAFGMLVTHINPMQSGNANDSNRRIDVEEADGLDHLDSHANRGDEGDVWPGNLVKRRFDSFTYPDTRNYLGQMTGVGLTNIANPGQSIIGEMSIPNNNGKGHLTHAETMKTIGIGFGSTTCWTALSVDNNTGMNRIDGVHLRLRDTSTVDIHIYNTIAGGTLGGLLHSETGFNGTAGWNRFLLASPQTFPPDSTRVLVLEITSTSTSLPVAFDYYGESSGNSWYSPDGQGTWNSMSAYGDLAQYVLMSTTTTRVDDWARY